MKRLILVSAIVLAFCSNAHANILTFDDLALGDYGDSFNYNDVTIKTYSGSHLQVTDQTADGFGNANSLPNKLSVWGEQPWVPIEKTSFSVNFDFPAEQVSFWITGNGHDTTVNAYNAAGGLVSSFVLIYPQDAPLAPDGTHWDYYYDKVLRSINVEGANISKLTIQPSAYDGFSIDDLAYKNVVVTPEPVSMILFGIGGAAMAFRRFRQKKA